MDMMKNNTHVEIINTVISIKDSEYSEIPSELIEQLILAEHENTDNYSAGLRDVKQLVDKYLRGM